MNKRIVNVNLYKISAETGELVFYDTKPEDDFKDIIIEKTKLKNRLIIKFNSKKSSDKFLKFIDILEKDLAYIVKDNTTYFGNQVLVINYNWQIIDIRYKEEVSINEEIYKFF